MNRMLYMFLVFTLIKGISFGSEENKAQAYSRPLPKSEMGELETLWGIGIGVNQTPFESSKKEPALFVQIETKKKGALDPLWGVRIRFQNREPQVFSQDISLIGHDFSQIKTHIGMGILGMLGSILTNSLMSSGPHHKIDDASFEDSNEDLGSSLFGSRSLRGNTGALLISALYFSGWKGYIAGGLLGFSGSVIVSAIKEYQKSQKRSQSIIILDYYLGTEITDEEETRIFLERTGQSLRNDDDDETSVRRIPAIGRLGNIFRSSLFYTTLTKPIMHIADLYINLINIYPQSVPLSPARLPLYSSSGISKESFVRNSNSFSIFCSERCFGIPFSLDPRLEDYVDDSKLRRRWNQSIYPTYTSVIERILHSYERIRERNPQFTMNRELMSFIGTSLDFSWKDSSITKALKEMERRD